MSQKFGSENRQQRLARERKETTQNQALSELMQNSTLQYLVVKFNDKEWSFSYRELNWETWMKHMGNNWKDDGTFNVGKYYQDMLLDSIVSFPDGSNPTRSILQSFAPNVMFQLMDLVPKPSLGEDMENSKKELTPLETETELEEMETD